MPSCPEQRMQQGQKPIFVLDISDKADFAFEAESLAQAQELSQAPWFVQAVSAFYARKCRERTNGTFRGTRPATETEASIYRDLADEFADESNCFLIAHLSHAHLSDRR
jgi:hypothetical protein